MFHLRCYWIVVCSVSLLLTSCGSKKTAEVIKAESQKSVALISHLKGHGVGFFIEGAAGVCTLLTAKHVVPDGKEISILTMTSKLPFKPLNIRRADNADLAVVTFKPLDGNCPFPALKLGDSKDLVLTQPIYISSYPGGVNGQAPKQSFYISNVIDKTPGGADGYELGYKTDTLGGTSGSPVLNDFGEVIAVHGRSYINKDSNPNDRAYLDLGVPINIYKQDMIFKLKELQLTNEKTLSVKDNWEINWLRILQVSTTVGTIIILIKIKFSKSNSELVKTTIFIVYVILVFTISMIPLIYVDWGNAKSKLGKNEEAIADYNRAIKFDPNCSPAYTSRGIVKSSLGKKQEAIADYNLAIKLDPNAYMAYNNRGIAKSALGKKEEAIDDYNQAIELHPSYSNAYINRGIAKSVLGKKEEAKVDYQEAAKLYFQQGNMKNYQDALNRIKALK